MKKLIYSHRRSLVGPGLIAALGASAFAMAQPAPAASDAPATRMAEDPEALREEHLAMRAERRVAREAGREARLEGHLAFMRNRLGITDAQAPLWDAFAENHRNNMLERVEARPEPRDPDAGRPSLVERLERQQARLAARVDRLDATANNLVPLYSALDNEQKEIADRVFRHLQEDRFAMRGERGRRGDLRGGQRGDRWRGRRGGQDFGGQDFGGQDFESLPQQL